MKTPEEILQDKKYKSLSNLVLICEAMEDYAREVTIVALAKAQKQIEELNDKIKHNAEGWQNAVKEKDMWKDRCTNPERMDLIVKLGEQLIESNKRDGCH